MKHIFYLLLASLFLFSCTSETAEEATSENESTNPETTTPNETVVEETPEAPAFDYCKCIEEANKKADEVINGTLTLDEFLEYTEVECAPFSEMTVEEMNAAMAQCSELVQEYQEKIMTSDQIFGE